MFALSLGVSLLRPRLASVSRWFTNGRVELELMDEARCYPSGERRVVKPDPGVLLALDERRPRYTGERVLLWGKNSCAALASRCSSIGRPATGCSTLCSDDFIRVPCPAARMMTASGRAAELVTMISR